MIMEDRKLAVVRTLSVAFLVMGATVAYSLGTRGTLSPSLWIMPLLCWLFGLWALFSTLPHKEKPSPLEENTAGGTPAAPAIPHAVSSVLPGQKYGPILQRVWQLTQENLTGNIIANYDNPTDTKTFTVQTSTPGQYANSAVRENIINTILKSIPKGAKMWAAEPRPAEDSIVFTRKKPFPKVLTPPIPSLTIPQSAKEAHANYPKWRLPIGQDALGNVMDISLAKIPHGIILGGSGAGKSVTMRSLIEQFRAAGFMIFICDGKGSDYTSSITTPNMLAIASTPADWVRMVGFIDAHMNERYQQRRMRDLGMEGSTPYYPPLIFIMDEYKQIKDTITGTYGKKAWGQMENTIGRILQLGRQEAVHMIIATQGIKADVIPTLLQNNIGYRIALGVPDHNIVNMFTQEVKDEARRIGESISKEDKGRGIVEVTSDDGNRVVEFQSYMGWSPATPPEDINVMSGDVQARWGEWQNKVYEKIKPLYPRMWWRVPDGEISDDVLGQIDLDMGEEDMPVTCAEDIEFEALLDPASPGIEWFTLARPGEKPSVEMRKFDPADILYVGNNVAANGGGSIEF